MYGRDNKDHWHKAAQERERGKERKVHESMMQGKKVKDHKNRALNANFNGCVCLCMLRD